MDGISVNLLGVNGSQAARAVISRSEPGILMKRLMAADYFKWFTLASALPRQLDQRSSNKVQIRSMQSLQLVVNTLRPVQWHVHPPLP